MIVIWCQWSYVLIYKVDVKQQKNWWIWLNTLKTKNNFSIYICLSATKTFDTFSFEIFESGFDIFFLFCCITPWSTFRECVGCYHNKTSKRTLLKNIKAIRCILSSVLSQSSASMYIYECVNNSGEKQSCITDVVKFISSAASTRVSLCNGALVPKGNIKIGSDAWQGCTWQP